MKKYTFIFIIVSSLLILLLTGCEHIEDTNGDNIELVTISLEKLSGSSISGTSSGYSSNSTRNNITIVSNHEDIDFDSYSRQGGLSSGIFNIMATELEKGETMTIYCNTTVDSGNIGMVLITKDYELIHQFSINQSDSYTVTATETTEYIVRLGAESYTGNIELSREFE